MREKLKSLVVCDDDSDMQKIDSYCGAHDEIEVIGKFTKAIEAIKYINSNEVDLLLLDLCTGSFNGFDLLLSIREPKPTVLISNDPNHAVSAFEFREIIDFNMKPLTEERFKLSVKKACDHVQSTEIIDTQEEVTVSKSGDLYINIDRRLTKLKIEDILFIKANGDYIDVRTKNAVFVVHSTLKKIKEKLPSTLFLQTHRSYLINYTKIIDIEDNSVLIEKTVIPISRANKPELIKRLNLL